MVLLAGVAGAVGTAGWFDISLTSTWEGGEISLSSASSLLALSVALTLLQGWGKSRPLQILVAVLALAAGGTLAILLWAGLAGVPLEEIWRDWFTSAASRRAGGGSPWTAASWTLFALLAAIGLLGLFPPLAARRWGRVVSITAVLLGVTFSLLVAALRAAGAGVLIPLAFRPTASFTAVGFAALFVGIGLAQGLLSRSLVLFAGSVAADLPESLQERRKRLYLALAVLLVVLATALGGTGYLGLHLVQEQRQVRSTLSAVAKLKVEQIALWRRERAGDAEALRENPVFRNAPEGFAPELLDEATRARWTRFLESFRRAYSYRSIELFDRELRPMLAVAAGALPVQPVDPTQAQLLRRANEIAWRDLRREADGSIGLQLLVPLRRESDGEFAGLFRLTIDARQALFPLVQNPHGEKGTTELLLYRQEGTRILYLSELRFRPEAALQFVDAIRPRRLVSEPDAFVHQQVQLFESTDYRGVAVLSVEQPVPGTDWMLVHKINVAEAFASARTEALQVALGGLLLLVMFGATLRILWRQRQDRLLLGYAAADRAQRELTRRLGLVVQHANDGIILFEQGSRIVEVNDCALHMYGRTREAFLTLSARDLRADEVGGSTVIDFAMAISSTGKLFETVHRRSDGTTFDVEVSACPVEIEGRAHVLSIIRDVSLRKQQQQEIENLSRLYRVISQINEAIMRRATRDDLLREICVVIVESGRFKIAAIGMIDEATQLIKPVATAGDHDDYLEGLLVSVDPAVPEGQGPSGTAVREGRTYVCNDFLTDPAARQWWDRARRSGIRASIALPLYLNGKPVGTLNVYAGAPHYFGPREVALLEEAAGNVSFALDVFAGERQREQAERALLESQARFRFLVSASPAIIYSRRYGGDSVTTFISENIREVLGYDPDQFVAAPGFWRSCLHPEDGAELTALTDQLVEGDVVTREYRFRHADGTYRWMYDQLRMVRNDAGRPVEMVGYWLDITSRKEAEASLRAREDIFSAIVEQALDSTVLIDPVTFKFVEFNTAAHERLGYSRVEFAALTVPDIEGLKTAAEIRQASDVILSAGVGVFETIHRHRDGRRRDTRVSLRAVKIGDRKLLAAIWTDITEAKRLSKELQMNEEQHHMLFENLELGVLYIGADGMVTDANPAACRILARTPDELRGESLHRPTLRFIRDDGSPLTNEERPAMIALRTARPASGVIEGLDLGAGRGIRWLSVSALPLVRPGSEQPDRVFVVFEDITERRRAETQVRKLSQVVEQSPMSIVITDLAGAIEYVNPRFTAVSGYSLAELRGQNPRALKSGLTPPAVFADLWRTIGAGKVWSGEVINKKKNGELITELVVITSVLDAQGRPSHYVAVKEDISERKRSEERLRKLSRVIEQAPLSVMITGLRGAIEYVNPAFCENTGYGPAEVLGRNPRILKSGETPVTVYSEMWAALARGEVWRGELSNRKKNGEIYVEKVVIAPVVDEQGRATHYVAIKEDISERKHTAETLQRTEELYRYIADNTSDAIWVFDFRKNGLTYVSPASERLLGYPAVELLGQSMARTLTPAAAERADASVKRRVGLLRAGVAAARTSVEIMDYVHRDGRTVRGEVVTTLVLDPDGNPLQLLGVTRDVTDRERAADDLRQSRDRLSRAEQMAHLGNWIFELATKRISWSEEVYRIFEFDATAGEPTLPQFLARVHPQEREWVEATFKAAVEQRIPYQITHRLVFPGDRIKYIEASGEASFGADGIALRAMGTVQDVTERKLVEIEMHEVVKQLRVLHFVAAALDQADLSGEALLAAIAPELPRAMRFPEHAQAFIEIDGASRTSGAEGKPLEGVSAPITINGRMSGVVVVSYVAVHPHAAASLFFERERETIESVARTIGIGLSARDSFAVVQGFNVELEQRIKQRTAELAGRNREVQALLNAMPDLVVRLRADGTILNRHQARHSESLAPLLHGDSAVAGNINGRLLARCLEAGTRALNGDETFALEADLGGTEAHLMVELRAAPVTADEFVIFIRDITERKRIEAETALMLEKEREVSEMKTRFISVTSHEFRTPMSVALGSLEILRNHLERLAPAKRNELFVRITESLQRMTSMLDDMLILSRVDAGRTRVEFAAINLPQFLQRVVDEVRIGDCDAHPFVLTVEGDATGFHSDVNILHHIVSNLLINAAHYSGAGTTIAVTLQVDATQARLAIADKGIGIPEADLKRIFDAFERGSNVGIIKGSGLGLNIVKRMTDILGGKIAVESTLGVGTCFTVEIPARNPGAA